MVQYPSARLKRWTSRATALCAGAAALPLLVQAPSAAQAWEPTKPIQFIIPAGTGGGADQMARFIQGVVAKNNLAKQPIITINKAGGAGAEGFLEVKKSAGDPHNIIITLSNLFTTPLATGVPFSWKDLTPVAMLALDQFILWVPADAPYKTAKDYINAVKAAGDKSFKMGGTGSKQEDQIITVALEKLTAPKKFTYIPYKGGGAVAVQLVGKHINSSVNNPIEAVSHWKAGALRPLCLFDSKRSIYTKKVTQTMAWSDIPTCKESGVDTEYQMLRGIFMSPGAKAEHVAYYVDLFKKVMATNDWRRASWLPASDRARRSASCLASSVAVLRPQPLQHPRETSAMNEKDAAEDEGSALVSSRTMEIIVALLLLGGAAIVISDSLRLGFGWQEGVGPAAGYFPFWVATILGLSSLVTLVATVVKPGGGETFVSMRPFGRVLAVLVPSLVYVALIGGFSLGPVTVPGIGIYVASAIFMCGFMLAIGREGVLKSVGVSVAVPLVLFLMFERWFLVPLPKGPLEAWLGY
jgi:putative tricarboxylic transport membrane protein